MVNQSDVAGPVLFVRALCVMTGDSVSEALRHCLRAFVLVPLLVAAAVGQQKGGEEAFLLSGVKDGRDRLRSGVYTAHGRKLQQESTDSVASELSIDLFSAFDRDRSLFRFDREEGGGKRAESNTTARCIISEKQIIAWLGRKTNVTVFPAGDLRRLAPIRPFEISIVGLAPNFSFREYSAFTEVWSGFTKAAPTAERESGSLYRLQWEGTLAPGVRRVLWVDSEKGYAPIRHELSMLNPDQNGEAVLLEMSDTTWENHADVWVPKTFALEEHYNSPRVSRLELSFEWHQVNEPIADKLFSMDDLKLPTGVFHVKMIREKPIVVERLGEEDPVTIYDSFDAIRWTIVGVIGAAVVLVGLRWVRSSIRSARQSKPNRDR